MNIYSPLLGICRTVEADVLDYFSHRPDHATPLQIARATGRSRSEIIKCLRHLDDARIIRRLHPTSHSFALLRQTPVGSILTQFAELPRRLADDIATHARLWPVQPLSVIVAGQALSELLARKNLVLVVTEPGSNFVEHRVHFMRRELSEKYYTEINTVIGSPPQIKTLLDRAEVNLYTLPLSPSTLKDHVALGLPLQTVLKRAFGGTGGI